MSALGRARRRSISCLRDFPLSERITSRLGLPVTLDNDANCATVGEFWLGAARGGRNVVGITIGTGIGGGVDHQWRVVSTARPTSPARSAIPPSTSTDATVSAAITGASRRMRRAPQSRPRAREAVVCVRDTASLCFRRWSTVCSIASPLETVYECREERRPGSPTRSFVIQPATSGPGSRTLLNVINPDTVVIAGGVIRAGEALLTPLRTEVRRRAFRPAGAARIVPAELPGTAGVVGAVAVFKMANLGRL